MRSEAMKEAGAMAARDLAWPERKRAQERIRQANEIVEKFRQEVCDRKDYVEVCHRVAAAVYQSWLEPLFYKTYGLKDFHIIRNEIDKATTDPVDLTERQQLLRLIFEQLDALVFQDAATL